MPESGCVNRCGSQLLDSGWDNCPGIMPASNAPGLLHSIMEEQQLIVMQSNNACQHAALQLANYINILTCPSRVYIASPLARSEYIWSGQARMWVWSIRVGVVSQK